MTEESVGVKEREKDELICQAIRAIAATTEFHPVSLFPRNVHSLPRLDLSRALSPSASLYHEVPVAAMTSRTRTWPVVRGRRKEENLSNRISFASSSYYLIPNESVITRRVKLSR